MTWIANRGRAPRRARFPKRLGFRAVIAAFLALGAATPAAVASETLRASETSMATETSTDEARTIELRHRTLRDWDIVLPAPKWNPVATGLDFERTRGLRFAAGLEGTTLRIDTDADGTLDVNTVDDEAVVSLKVQRGDETFKYAVRLIDRQGWHYRSTGVLEGRVGSTRIRLIDQNNNGSFSDVGVDAMIVGRSQHASFLSEVVSIDGQLQRITIDDRANTLRLEPYSGKRGRFRLAKCETKAKVLSAVIQSADARYSFDLADAESGIELPTGHYAIVTGALGIGESRVSFETGRSQMLSIRSGEEASLNWGGPVAAEFAYQRQGDELVLSPDRVWYYGKLGELYHGWDPIGKSPRFVVRALKTGREIAEAFFPGTC